MKRLLLLASLALVPAVAYAAEFAKKTTTLAADTDACTTPSDSDCYDISTCADKEGALCGAGVGKPWDISSFQRLALTISNTGANTLSDVLILMSADGSNWEVWNSLIFDELAAGTTLSAQIDANSRRYMKVIARSNSGTTVIVTISSN